MFLEDVKLKLRLSFKRPFYQSRLTIQPDENGLSACVHANFGGLSQNEAIGVLLHEVSHFIQLNLFGPMISFMNPVVLELFSTKIAVALAKIFGVSVNLRHLAFALLRHQLGYFGDKSLSEDEVNSIRNHLFNEDHLKDSLSIFFNMPDLTQKVKESLDRIKAENLPAQLDLSIHPQLYFSELVSYDDEETDILESLLDEYEKALPEILNKINYRYIPDDDDEDIVKIDNYGLIEDLIEDEEDYSEESFPYILINPVKALKLNGQCVVLPEGLELFEIGVKFIRDEHYKGNQQVKMLIVSTADGDEYLIPENYLKVHSIQQ